MAKKSILHYDSRILDKEGTECFRADRALSVVHALLKLGRHHRLNEATVREVWHLAGEKHFVAGARPSNICNNGTPLEVSVSMGTRTSGLRYLTELGEGKKGWECLDDSRKKIPQLLKALGLPLNPLLCLIDELIPETPDQFPPLRFGMWVSPMLLQNKNLLKVYINTGWRHATDVWQRVFCLLELMNRREVGERLKGLLSELTRFHRLSFVGLENTTDGIGRLKLYFRGTALTREWIERIACIAGNDYKLLSKLWQAFFADREIGPEDAVLSVSLPQDDQPLLIKVDVVAKEVGLPNHDIPSRIEEVVSAEDLDPSDYLATLKVLFEIGGLPAQHTVIGISTTGDRPRINVYLMPVFSNSTQGLKKEKKGVGRGTSYV